MLVALQERRKRQLVVCELLAEAQRHEHEQQARERSERGKAKTRAQAQGAAADGEQRAATAGPAAEATVALVAQRGSAAGRLSRPQLQALAHLRRCAPTATALSARGRRSGVGSILAAASGGGGGGSGHPYSAPSASSPAGPAYPNVGGWFKRLPWPQPNSSAAGGLEGSSLIAEGPTWTPFVWSQPDAGPLPAVQLCDMDLPQPSAPTLPTLLHDWSLFMAGLDLTHHMACGPKDLWERRHSAQAAALSTVVRPEVASAVAWAAVRPDSARLLQTTAIFEVLEAVRAADEARLSCALSAVGLADVRGAWCHCRGLGAAALRKLAEGLRRGLLRASGAWAQLAWMAAEDQKGQPCYRGALQVLRAAVTGLILLHGIPSAALEPWGGEGQGPEPLACAGVAMLRMSLEIQFPCGAVHPGGEAPQAQGSVPPPALIHFALCNGPIAAPWSMLPLDHQLERYTPKHVEWVEAQLFERGFAYIKEAELMRAAMSQQPRQQGAARPAGAGGGAASHAQLEALAREAQLLQLWLCGALGRPTSPLREVLDAAGQVTEASGATSGLGGGVSSSCTVGPGPQPQLEPSSSAVAVTAPKTSCCHLFDPLWVAAAGPPGSAGTSAGGSGGGPHGPEPWEAEMPWLAWLARQGLLEAPDGALEDAQGRYLAAALEAAEAEAGAAVLSDIGAKFFLEAAATVHGGLLEEERDQAHSLLFVPAASNLMPLVHGGHLPATQGQEGLAVEQAMAPLVEYIWPYLLPNHPRTWGRLLRGPELLEEQPEAVEALRMAFLGLLALMACTGNISLGACALAGWAAASRARSDTDAQAVIEPTRGAAVHPEERAACWGGPVLSATRLLGILPPLLSLPALTPRPTWTCAAHTSGPDGAERLPSSTCLTSQAGPLPGSQQPDARQQLGLARAMARAGLLFRDSPVLAILLSNAAEAAREVQTLGAGGDAAAARAAHEAQAAAARRLGAEVLYGMSAEARTRLREGLVLDAVAAAAASGFALDTRAALDPARQVAPAPPGLSGGGSQAQGQAQAQVQAQALPCFGPGRDAAERMGALVRVAGSSPAHRCSLVDTARLRGPLPPQSVVVEGPVHTTLLLMMLSRLSFGEGKFAGEYAHVLRFLPQVLPVPAGGAAAGLAAYGKQGPHKKAAADAKGLRMVLLDIQAGHLPMEDGAHRGAYPWALMCAVSPKITATSAYGRPRAAHLKTVREALVDKGWGAVWVSGCGVEGVQGALLLAAEMRQEMLALGRDCCVAVTSIDYEPARTLAKETAAEQRQQGSAGGAAGRSSSAGGSAAPGPDTWIPGPIEACAAALERLVMGSSARRDLVIEARLDARSVGGLTAVTAREEERLREAESELLGLLSPGPGGCGPLREGVLVQLRIMECAPGRPGELVLPDMRRHRALRDKANLMLAITGPKGRGQAR
ncbi:hypothetical protein HYH03_007040 [Edaphochlamys debaryana]|uniref:Uncharacterized protein n=1 Tax=Edaphochlamys debaryana TaxID=47281 RepID=A0A835Y418_9CHLO|nr:hypothetical protein HYH03_007040 [Edaphochlamys debaryana]|eukprot:KAG2494797.1 hypothetical protein HYH03_007040 [Edaphochlamys debaryana]